MRIVLCTDLYCFFLECFNKGQNNIYTNSSHTVVTCVTVQNVQLTEFRHSVFISVYGTVVMVDHIVLSFRCILHDRRQHCNGSNLLCVGFHYCTLVTAFE